jgi:glycosyltransferase involved in cell wall biosynthesis
MPPLRGGLADHTQELARQLARENHVTVVSSREVYTDMPYEVRPNVFDWSDPRQIEFELAQMAPDTVVIWQYVPHMYGRGGVNGSLAGLWRRLRRQGFSQVVLAHEIAAGWGRRPNHWWYAWNHRRQWRAALKHADLVPISTEAWCLDWQRREPGRADRLFTLPSPTSVPPVPVPADHRAAWRQAHGFAPDAKIIAWFGTVSLAKQLDWVLDAWEAANHGGDPVTFCLIGGTPSLPIPGSLRARFKMLGYLPLPEVSEALQAADLLLLPFVDGASERRTTLMAGLAHGVPTVTTVGPNTGPTLAAAPFLERVPVGDSRPFVEAVLRLLRDEPARRALGEAGRRQHDLAYSWPVTIATLRRRMAEAGIAGL